MNCLVGHWSNSFDAPFLLRRAWALGIQTPAHLIPEARGKRRYWPDVFMDLNDLWAAGVFRDGISLDRFAKHLGLAGKNGEGKGFHKLLATDPDAAIEYAINDVRVTKAIHEHLLGLTETKAVKSYTRYWYYDIETGPLPEKRILEVAPAFDSHAVKTGQMKFEKAQAKIKLARENHLEKIVSEAALNAEYGQVLAIAYIDPDGEETVDVGDERKLVGAFWKLANEVWESKPE